MERFGVIYRYQPSIKFRPASQPSLRTFGLSLIVVAAGGIFSLFLPQLQLEAGYWSKQIASYVNAKRGSTPVELPKAAPVIFNPLVTEDGASISPVNTDFSLIIPKIGINAGVIPAVNPAKPGEYLEALERGIAHASTSYFPNEEGTVYLFSHSTNYDWFVRDLNAVFYLLKNLSEGDLIVLFYKGNRYTYRLSQKRVVGPNEVSYLVPQTGSKKLILQTCWPPGSLAERLLIFADLVEEQSKTI